MKIDNVLTSSYAKNKVLVNNLEVRNQLATSAKDLEVFFKKKAIVVLY